MTVHIWHLLRAGWVIDFGDALFLYDTSIDAYRHRFVPFLWSHLGKRRIDGIFHSHYHHDHVGTTKHLLPQWRGKVGAVYSSGVYSSREGNDQVRQAEIDAAVAEWGVDHIHVERGDVIEVPGQSGARFEVVCPHPEDIDVEGDGRLSIDGQGRIVTDDPNDERNCVVRLVHGDFTMLFTGDVGPPFTPTGLPDAANLYNVDISAKVLQHPHHGDINHMTSEIADLVDPEMVVLGAITGQRSVDSADFWDGREVDYVWMGQVGEQRYSGALLQPAHKGTLHIEGHSDGSFTYDTDEPPRPSWARGGSGL